MRQSTFVRLSSCLPLALLLAHCSSAPSKSSGDDDDDDGGSSGRAAGGTTGGTSPMAGRGGTSGSATGGTSGTTTAGTSGAATAGTSGSTTAGSAGSVSNGGTPATGGTNTAGGGGTGPVGGAGAGGTNAAGSGAGPAGGAGAGGTDAAGGPNVNMNGVGLAKPGDQKTGSSEYLRLGDLRLLNNKWGSDDLNCNTSMRIFVNADKSVGWDFNRGTCGGAGEKPDYPEIEFGVHPFGAGNALETSPPFSSTQVLPLQIKDITSASVRLDSLHIALQNQKSWNINFEFWLSQRNPATDPNPGVYAELIIFWGWQNGRWPCDMSGDVNAGDNSYHLCHQSDTWANGQWRYYQFWVNGGPFTDYSGRVDVKALIDYLVNQRGYSPDLWVTRFEVGSEIDDETSGTVTVKNVTFEVNGTSKAIELGQ